MIAAVACTRSVEPASPGAASPAPIAPGSAIPAYVAKLPPVLPPGDTFVVQSLTPDLSIWRGPTIRFGRKFIFPTVNPVGQSLAFLVTGTARDGAGNPWLHVLLPIRPNEAAGWVKKTDVRVMPVDEKIVVDLSQRTLVHYRGGRVVDRFSVGIGRPETPTAAGTFYVWARVPQASAVGPYGVFALGLSGFSPVLKNWPGGGRMAIHGTANSTDRGQMVSHGCVRVLNADMVT